MNGRIARSLKDALLSDNVAEFNNVVSSDDWAYNPLYSGEELLTQAFHQGSKKIVVHLLDSGCSLNRYNLHSSLEKIGWIDVTMKLLSLGARVSEEDSDGNTALHRAFLKNTPDCVLDAMIERYVNESQKNLGNKDGLTFLHILCTRTSVDALRRFLHPNEMDVNVQVGSSSPMFAGYTPLHFAAEYGRVGMAQVLLNHTANIYIQDKMGSTPLHLSLRFRHVGMINLLFDYDYQTKNIKNGTGLSHFMAACAGSKLSIVQKFISNEQSVTSMINDQVTSYQLFGGYAPIHWAAEFGRFETVKLLLDHGADCCSFTDKTLTPAILAQRNNFQEVADLLDQYHRRKNVQKGDHEAAYEDTGKHVKARSLGIRICCRFLLSFLVFLTVTFYFLFQSFGSLFSLKQIVMALCVIFLGNR